MRPGLCRCGRRREESRQRIGTQSHLKVLLRQLVPWRSSKRTSVMDGPAIVCIYDYICNCWVCLGWSRESPQPDAWFRDPRQGYRTVCCLATSFLLLEARCQNKSGWQLKLSIHLLELPQGTPEPLWLSCRPLGRFSYIYKSVKSKRPWIARETLSFALLSWVDA